jgi:hypothetical protein
MRKRNLVLWFAALSIGLAFFGDASRVAAAVMELEWNGGVSNPSSVQQVADGGYIAVTGVSVNALTITKLDSGGERQWEKRHNGLSGRIVFRQQSVRDGYPIVAGYTTSSEAPGYHGGTDAWVGRLDDVAAWQKALGGSGTDYAYSIQQTADGGYIVAGYTNSTDGDVNPATDPDGSGNHGGYDAWMVKLDGAGNITWQNALGGSGYDQAEFIQQTADGGYIVAGYSQSIDGDLTEVNSTNFSSPANWIVKLDAGGNMERQYWWGRYGSASFAQQTSDEGYIVIGGYGTPAVGGASGTTLYKLAPEGGGASGNDLMLSAAFSQIAYENKKETDRIWESRAITYGQWFAAVAGGWERVQDTPNLTSGLYAVTFRNLVSGRLIIAFRGTEVLNDFVRDGLWADLLMTSASASAQFKDALAYYKLWKDQYPNMDITLTGHSLGGALAAYVSMHTGAKAIAFNGAVGYTIDMAYKSDSAVLAKTFTGTEGWNFENHITVTDSGFNKWVAYPNREYYDSFMHEKSDSGKSDHDVDSFLTWDGAKFGFTAASRSGSKADGAKIIYHDARLNPTNNLYLYLGSLVRDMFPQKTDKEASVYAYSGGGDDGALGSKYADFLAGGSGANIVDPLEGKDIIAVTDGDDTINDPSGEDKIMLLGSVRVSSAVEEGNYYKVALSNNHYLRVNKSRNLRYETITVVDENGNTLGRIGGGSGWKAGASSVSDAWRTKAAEDYPTTKHVEIEGKATFKVYDESGGSLLGTFTADADASLYMQFGYFYTRKGEGEGEKPSITAILFNEKYNLRVESAASVRYTIFDFDEEDAPKIKFDLNVPLKIGLYLETRSDFGAGSDVPFIIRDSVTNEEIDRLSPEPKDPSDDSEPDGGDIDSNKELRSIVAPAAITDLPNGTAKTEQALGLPATVTMVTNDGNVSANVTWNVGACSYNPASKIAQTFTVDGTAALPSGVVNTGGVSLTVSVSVAVKAAGDGTTPPRDPIVDIPEGSDSGGCNAGFGAAGWIILAIGIALAVKPRHKHKP